MWRDCGLSLDRKKQPQSKILHQSATGKPGKPGTVEVVWLSPLLENGVDWLLCKVASVLNLETSGGAYESLAQVSEMIFQGSPLALALSEQN